MPSHFIVFFPFSLVLFEKWNQDINFPKELVKCSVPCSSTPWNVDPDLAPPQDELGDLLPLPAGLPGLHRRRGLHPLPQPREEADYSQ